MTNSDCPICFRTSYDPALIKILCRHHRNYYRVTKCKDCNEIVLSEFNQLCVPCMYSTPKRPGNILRRGKKRSQGLHARKISKPTKEYKPKFVLDVDGEEA